MACTGIHVLDPACQIGSIAGGAADDAFSKIANYFGQAAASAVDWMWTQLNDATTVDLSSPGVQKDLVVTGAIAVALCLMLFLIQLITSALRHDAGGLGRAVRGLFIGIAASSFAIAATQILLAAVDSLSAGVVKYATGTNIDGLGSRFALAYGLSSITNPAGLMLISLVLLTAVVIVWGAMMIRKMLLILSAVMAPPAFAGGAADITRSWVRRWIEFTAALVASKLILVIILMVGLSVFQGAGMQGHGAGQGATQLASGVVLLLLAGWAPWIAIKMFHFVGDSMHAVHAQSGAARAGTQAVIAAPRKVNGIAGLGSQLGATFSSSAASPAQPSASSPSQSPMPQAPSATQHAGSPGGGDTTSTRSPGDPGNNQRPGGDRSSVASRDARPDASPIS